MTEMKTANQVLQSIQEAAKNSTDETRFHRVMNINDIAHQGDVYLLRVNDNHPRGKKITETQLAPGTTKGSRHVAEGKKISIFETTSTNPLMGPVIVAKERFEVVHPEHANHSIPSGCYQVGYQLDAETRRRVMD